MSGGHISERLYVPELVINDWGDGTYMNGPVCEREENSHSNGRLLKGRALGVHCKWKDKWINYSTDLGYFSWECWDI